MYERLHPLHNTNNLIDISWLEMSKVTSHLEAPQNVTDWGLPQVIPTLFMHFDIDLVDPNGKLNETCW